jgi:hypothetical protein
MRIFKRNKTLKRLQKERSRKSRISSIVPPTGSGYFYWAAIYWGESDVLLRVAMGTVKNLKNLVVDMAQTSQV